jgi:predicted MFS family arabinose efflux permease
MIVGSTLLTPLLIQKFEDNMSAISKPSPQVEEANFRHLVWDIAWFGLALAATTRFLQFFALEMGASAMDLGWLTALPALIVLLTTTLSPWWRRRYDSSIQAVMIPGFIQRLAFLLPAFAPVFPEAWRVPWIVIASTAPMIGQGAVSAIFVLMMRETVDDSQLQRLLTRRHIAMNVTITIGAVAFGLMLEALPFPLNYQIMFVVAFGFAMASQWHLTRLRPLQAEAASEPVMHRSYRQLLADPAFRGVIAVLIAGFGAFHLVIAVIPIHLRNGLGATEGYMGVYGGLEVLAGFLAALGLNRLTRRFSNRTLIALSMAATALAVLVVALAPNREIALISALLNGAGWSIAGLCSFAFFAERTAKSDMHAAMVYHQIIYACIFVAPLMGSWLVDAGLGVVSVLLLGFLVRLLGAAVCEFGVDQRKKAKRYGDWVEVSPAGD